MMILNTMIFAASIILLKLPTLLSAPNVAHERELVEHLFSNYSIHTRPVDDPKLPLDVRFNMKLMRLLAVDEKHQKVTSQAYFGMCWTNAFLKWNPDDYGNVKYLSVNPDQVWLPDIVLKNNADSEAVTIQKDTDKVWLKYTGKNCWYPKVMMITSFKCDVTYFPFDNQNFVFHFGSWSFGETKLHITKRDDRPMLDKHYLKHAEWDLVHMRKDIMRTEYESDAYIEVLFTYFYSRKPTYSVITAIVPSIGLMSVALFSYLLPPGNGERITVLITTLLAFTVFLVEINQSLPRNSDSVPIIQVFYMVTVVECLLSFFLTCFLVRALSNKDKELIPFRIPLWVQRYVFQVKHGLPLPVFGNQTKICQGDFAMDIAVPSTDANRRMSGISVSMLTESESFGSETHHHSRMSWKVFGECINKIMLRVFAVVYVLTIACTFVPAYYRQWSIADFQEGEEAEGRTIWDHAHR